jgi:hypothetical protein
MPASPVLRRNWKKAEPLRYSPDFNSRTPIRKRLTHRRQPCSHRRLQRLFHLWVSTSNIPDKTAIQVVAHHSGSQDGWVLSVDHLIFTERCILNSISTRPISIG